MFVPVALWVEAFCKRPKASSRVNMAKRIFNGGVIFLKLQKGNNKVILSFAGVRVKYYWCFNAFLGITFTSRFYAVVNTNYYKKLNSFKATQSQLLLCIEKNDVNA